MKARTNPIVLDEQIMAAKWRTTETENVKILLLSELIRARRILFLASLGTYV
jgi:hypothetical protein